MLANIQSAMYGMEEVEVHATHDVAVQDERNPFKRFAKNVCTRALFWGVKSENLGLVQKCLKAGVYIDTQDATGSTALHYAAYNLNLDILTAFLVAKSINPTMYNNAGYTPIAIARECFQKRTQKRTELFFEMQYAQFKTLAYQQHGYDLTDGELKKLFAVTYQAEYESQVQLRETHELREFDIFLNCFAQLNAHTFPFNDEEKAEVEDARQRIFAIESSRQIRDTWVKELRERNKIDAVTFPYNC